MAWTLAVPVLAALAREPEPESDRWLTNAGARPENFAKAEVRSDLFHALHAEVVAGALQVKWDGAQDISNPRLVVSADAPGHWPARDWRSIPLRRAGAGWLAEIPVDSLDVPQIYFVSARENGTGIISPMRLAHPRGLGLEQPSRIFWAFLEGFEQELEGWRVSGPAPQTAASARSGRAALSVRVPAGQHAASVETTRLRGWFLAEHGASGVGLWLRTKSGTAAAAFTLVANAFTTNQVTCRRAATVTVSTNWTKAALLFESFPKLPLGEVDLFSIEFAAEPGTELLLDDLYLLGRWRDYF